MDNLLKELHRDGFTFAEMKLLLKSRDRHGYELSVQQLKRRAYKLGLYRRKGYSSIDEVLKNLQVCLSSHLLAVLHVTIPLVFCFLRRNVN